MAADAEQRRERRFASILTQRANPITVVILAANVALFVAMSLAAGIDPDTLEYTDALLNYGAMVPQLIEAGEYWRLLTPIFLHVGWLHLLVNSYSLWVIGPQVERLYGSVRFLVLYVVTGVAGVAASAAYTQSLMSAGASGAILGLVGVLLVFGIRYRSELPGVFKHYFGPAGLLPTILLNLYITFTVPMIDKAAHLAGLSAGCVLALAIPYSPPGERHTPAFWWAMATLCGVAVVAAFAMAGFAPHHDVVLVFGTN
jgi:rhomboid protease GluP